MAIRNLPPVINRVNNYSFLFRKVKENWKDILIMSIAIAALATGSAIIKKSAPLGGLLIFGGICGMIAVSKRERD